MLTVMTMYEKIVKLAERKGVSVAQVERDLGFSQASLRKTQQHTPSVEKVRAIARYFDVSMDYLYGNSELEKPADQLLDPDFISLQRARRNMSSAEWDQAMKIFRAGFSYAFEDDQ